MKILAKLFWRIIVPLMLALLLTIAGFFEFSGGHSRSRFASDDLGQHVYFWVIGIVLVASFATVLRNTLTWGKEADEFESELKEADAIEEARRRRTS